MNTKDVKPKMCKKHNTQLYYHPEEGYGCNQCEGENWDYMARGVIKGFKCPVCCEPVELEEHEENYIEFACKRIFDEKGNYAKPPCPSFRIQVCEECFSNPCQCQEYPEQPEQEFPY